MKKWLLSLIITFIVLILFNVLARNVKISFDKDSKYKAILPPTMRSALISNESDKDFYKNISVKIEKVPTINDNEVLVYVKSASFTQADFDFFKNHKNKKSFVPCNDFSGIVVNVGKNVKTYEIGDKVFGISNVNKRNGACADYVAVPENNIYTIPYSLTFKQAASIPTPGLLNWFAVHNLTKQGLKSGKVLIDDAISETGIMLTGLLVRNGFEVTAIDDESVESWVSNFGVKNFISNTRFIDEKDRLKNSFDVVFNLKYGFSANDLIDTLKPKGTFISFENVNVRRTDIKSLIIDSALVDKELFAKMARLVHLGKIQINVAKEYNLEHIRDAYMRAEKGNLNGKVVVNVNK